MIKFDRIDYNHFHTETKYEMDKKWLVYINPLEQSFYTSNHTYFALTFPKLGEVYLNMVIGTGGDKNYADGLRHFIKWVKLCNGNTIRFGTYSKNIKMITFYKYIKAEFVKEVSDYYDDGDSYVEYVLDIQKSSRFN